jgi:YD repeat-containing protein
MKKLILLSALFIFACSSEDSSNDDDNSIDAVLVERFELSFIDNDPNSSTFGEQYQSVYFYNYDGNKLTSIDLEIISEGIDIPDAIQVQYNTANQIANLYLYGGDITEYEYDEQGRMSVYTYTDVDGSPPGQPNSSITNLVYNQDGTVSALDQNGFGTTYTLDDDGNIVSINTNGSNEPYYVASYDNKNNPFKNVLGHSFYIWLNPLDIGGFNNNVISLNGVSWSYDYDSNNYPLTIYTSGMLGSAAPNDWDYASNINATITYTN